MMHHELEILRAGADHADTILLIHDINPISPKAQFVADESFSRNGIKRRFVKFRSQQKSANARFVGRHSQF